MQRECRDYVDYLIRFVGYLERDGFDIANMKLELQADLQEARAVLFVTKKEMLMIAQEILKASSVDDLQKRFRRLLDGE